MSKEVVHMVKCDRCKTRKNVNGPSDFIPEGWIKFTLQDLDEPHWYHLCKECTDAHNNFMEGNAVSGLPSEFGLGNSFGFGAMA